MTGPTIVYILCRGHSGSTLLDLLLSSHEQVASVGELKLIARGAEPRCSCDAGRVRDCGFWHDIGDRLEKDTGSRLFETAIESADPDELFAANRAVYRAVSEATGVRVLVDSSKEPVRLARLLRSGAFDLRVIHLVRHPCGVTYSRVRKGGAWWREAMSYGRKRGRAERLLAGQPHRVVRYEELATAPGRTIAGLMEWIGLPFQPSQLEWSGRVRHNIGGNRMRFGTSSEIRCDEAWRRLPLHQRVGIQVLAGLARLVARNAP